MSLIGKHDAMPEDAYVKMQKQIAPETCVVLEDSVFGVRGSQCGRHEMHLRCKRDIILFVSPTEKSRTLSLPPMGKKRRYWRISLDRTLPVLVHDGKEN